MHRALASLAVLLALACPESDGPITIADPAVLVTGTVRDASSVEPLVGVEVSRGEATANPVYAVVMVTGEDGRYEAAGLGLPAAFYRFSKDGYRTLERRGAEAEELSPGRYRLDVLLERELP